jgi:hypothetical protein
MTDVMQATPASRDLFSGRPLRPFCPDEEIMAQYYTLEQAAQILQVSVERMKDMVKKNEVRAFQDRGTLRFRSQDIEEKARQLGLGSDHELPLGEGAKPGESPSSAARRRAKAAKAGDSSATKAGTTPAPRSGASKKSKVEPPKASSDSDIRLVGEGSGEQTFEIEPEDSNAVGGPRSGTKPGSDSGAVILPLEGDSDVKLETDTPATDKGSKRTKGAKSPSDSDIRLEQVAPGGGQDKDHVTEEIDLDAEQAAARKSPPPTKPKAGSSGKRPALPTSSPFELSESDLELQPLSGKGPTTPRPSEKGVDSSSDFELATDDGDSSPVLEDDEVSLGELTGGGPARSGINLQKPGDSGISLEQGGSDEMANFMEVGKAADSNKGVESSSEFELSLEDEEGDSSSEFELTLDEEAEAANAPATPDSDSEFELTLDEEGDLAHANESDALGEDEEGKDIFEPTDFDVPALDSDSSSEAVALTESGEEGSSEFDLDLDEEALGESEEDAPEGGVSFDEDADERGGVVDVGDDDADEAAETIARPVKSRGRKAVAEEDEEDDPYAGIHEDDEEEEAEARPAAAAAAPLPAPEWGLFPALTLLPTVVILFVVGLMSFELSRSMLGYRGSPGVSGNLILQPLAKKLDSTLPDNK